jgi:hypothetical protein
VPTPATLSGVLATESVLEVTRGHRLGQGRSGGRPVPAGARAASAIRAARRRARRCHADDHRGRSDQAGRRATSGTERRATASRRTDDLGYGRPADTVQRRAVQPAPHRARGRPSASRARHRTRAATDRRTHPRLSWGLQSELNAQNRTAFIGCGPPSTQQNRQGGCDLAKRRVRRAGAGGHGLASRRVLRRRGS